MTHKAKGHGVSVLGYSVEQLSAVQEFHDNEDVGGVDVVLVDLYYVDVVDFNEEFDFLADFGYSVGFGVKYQV